MEYIVTNIVICYNFKFLIIYFQTFVYGNNLYYQSNPNTTPNIITTDGQPQRVFNAIPDWVYEGSHISCLLLGYIQYTLYNCTLVLLYIKEVSCN